MSQSKPNTTPHPCERLINATRFVSFPLDFDAEPLSNGHRVGGDNPGILKPLPELLAVRRWTIVVYQTPQYQHDGSAPFSRLEWDAVAVGKHTTPSTRQSLEPWTHGPWQSAQKARSPRLPANRSLPHLNLRLNGDNLYVRMSGIGNRRVRGTCNAMSHPADGAVTLQNCDRVSQFLPLNIF